MRALPTTIGTAEYFEAIHAGSPDPFGLTESWYEQRKRAISLAMLSAPRYQRAFEPGCSMGAFTAGLAQRCDEVIAFDRAGSAIGRAAAYLRSLGHENVRLAVARVPGDWPEGAFDLVVLGEVGYYLSPEELTVTLERAASSLAPGGQLLAVHWRPPIENCALTGDDVHELLLAAPGLALLARHVEERFRADLLEKASGGAS